MTEKQNAICFYYLRNYNIRRTSLIVGVSDAYVRRIINNVETIELDDYIPPIDCIMREQMINHIIQGAGYIYVPKSQKYAYISLLAYLGFDYKTLRKMFPEDISSFLYMAIHRSNKAWKTLDSDFIGIAQEDYENLMRINKRDKR